MSSIECTGKTYEEALQNGLKQLNASISDVEIQTLQEGSKGLLGLFGSRPYKLLLTMKEPEEDILAGIFDEPKPAARPVAPKAEKPAQPVQPKAEKPAAPKAEKPAAPKPEKPAQPKPEKPTAPKAEKPAQPKAEKPAAPKAEKPEEAAKPETEDKPRPVKRVAKKPQQPRPEKPANEEKPAAEKKPLPPKEPVRPLEKPVVTMIAADQVDPESAAGKAKAFLQELTGLMGVQVDIQVGTDTEENVFVYMTGDTLGILIGRRGETLDALQYLTSLKINHGQDKYTRVTLDTENYRAKREDTLTRLANRMANKAVKTGRKVSLEPMNPYERRIIHSALQLNDAVDTHSEGEEPNRHVVITLRK